MMPSKTLRAFQRSRLIQNCTQCGAPLFAPAGSEYLDDWHIRHFWSCDSCKCEFETTISLRWRPSDDVSAS
jgi:hypothetical protein